MRHVLLATTGLVAATAIAVSAQAATPKVTLGGFSDFQAGFVSEDNDGARRGHGFRNDNEISVNVDAHTDGGLNYGAVIELEADITNDADNQGTNAARTFTYLESGWGRAELGGTADAAATMRVDASSIAVATGGIAGAFDYFLAGGNPTVTTFIMNPKLIQEYGVGTAADEGTYNATKIAYYTPRWNGLQAGVSYTPDLENRGQFMDRNDQTAGNIGDVWDLALHYENTYENGLSTAASLTYEMGNADTAAREDVRAWNIGTQLGYEGFSVAGSYGDWGDSNRVANAGNDDAHYWTLGGAYTTGAIGVSATYLDSVVEQGAGVADNDFSNIVLGADYKLAPGLTTYAEVSFFEFDSATVADRNDGNIFILGTQIAF